MKATRSEVYVALDGERDYQEAGAGNARRHDGMPPMTPGELILCMEKCLADARTIWYSPDGGEKSLEYIRKVSALGIQAMELHGCPHRDGFSSSTGFLIGLPRRNEVGRLPIATAPRDGTLIKLWFDEDSSPTAGWYSEGYVCPWRIIDKFSHGHGLNAAIDGVGGPSHWAPL